MLFITNQTHDIEQIIGTEFEIKKSPCLAGALRVQINSGSIIVYL